MKTQMPSTQELQNPLSNIEFKKIDDKYCYGKYAKFAVIMMRKNGYINATKMCLDISKQNGSKKPFKHWRENKSADELINAVSLAVGIPTTELFKIVSGGSITEISGTFVHPKLILHVAMWASPIFAIKVSDIMTEYFDNKERRKHQRELHEKDDKIDKLMEKVDKQSEEIHKQTEEIHELLRKNKHISHKLSDIEDQNEELGTKIDRISEDRVVIPPNASDMPVFIVMKDNGEHVMRRKKYYVIRTKRCSARSAIKKYKLEHENSTVLINIEYNPNSINLWDRAKARLKNHIKRKLNYFGLRNDYTEEQLIEDINELNDEKYDD